MSWERLQSKRIRDLQTQLAAKDAEIAGLTEVARWAQAVLTALNVGAVESESLLHLKLREVMITYRKEAAALLPEEGK